MPRVTPLRLLPAAAPAGPTAVLQVVPTRPDLAAFPVGPFVERPAEPYPGAVLDELSWHLVKVLREDARLASDLEVEARTPAGPAVFTLDLAVDVPVDGLPGTTRRVAVEAGDGRDLREHARLLRRDAALLASGAADAVVRVGGTAVLDRLEDVLFLIAQWDADLFSERGRINLRTLASPEARAVAVRPEQPGLFVPVALEGEAALWHVANGQPPHLRLRRLDARLPDVWRPYAPVAPPALTRVDAPARPDARRAA